MEWIKTSDCLPTLFGGISNWVEVWNDRYNYPEMAYLDKNDDGTYDWVAGVIKPLDYYKHWMPIFKPEEE